MNRWTRREVLQGLGRLPLFAGLSAVTTACGGGSDSGSSGYGGGGGGGGGGSSTLTCTSAMPNLEYTISGSHTHNACISQALLNTPANATITLTDSGHTHEIVLTMLQIQEIKDGGANHAYVSTNGPGHEHTVTYLG